MRKDIEPKCNGCEKLLLITNTIGESYAACRISKDDYKPLLGFLDEYTKWYNSNKGKNVKCWSEFESDYRPLWCPKCSLEALSKDLYETNKLACDIVVDNIMKEYKKDKSNMKEIEGVNHPKHYNQGDIECISAMIAAKGIEAVKNFCDCCVFKYEWRLGQKDAEEKEIGKMKWYLDKYLELSNELKKKDNFIDFKTITILYRCKKDYNPCRNIEFNVGKIYELKKKEGVMYLKQDGCAFHTTQKVLDEYFELLTLNVE